MEQSSRYNERFFTPVISCKIYRKEPWYNETLFGKHILSNPWSIIMLSFYCILVIKKKIKLRYCCNELIILHCICNDLKAHVHPDGFARLCFCFETTLLSNAVFWLASTFEEHCVTILQTTARKTSFFHTWPKLKEAVSKRPVRLEFFSKWRKIYRRLH